MAAYTVTAVEEQTRDWGDDMREHRVTLRNADGREKGPIKLNRKRTATKPNPGDVLEIVDISDKGFGLVAKEARKPGGGGGGGWKPKPPEERRSIAMQSSGARGAEIVCALITSGAWKPDSADMAADAALKIASRFFEQVQKAEAGS
jgi:hypothetical protein